MATPPGQIRDSAEALRMAGSDLLAGLAGLYQAPPASLMICVHGQVVDAQSALSDDGSLVLAALIWYVNGAAVFTCGGLAYPVQISVDGTSRPRHDQCVPADLRIALVKWVLQTLWPDGLGIGQAADAGLLIDSVRNYQATYPMSVYLAPEDLAPAFAMWGTQALCRPVRG